MFVQDYGVYTEMVYLIAGGNILEVEKVFEMPAHKFLFWSEYLMRNRKVEVIK